MTERGAGREKRMDFHDRVALMVDRLGETSPGLDTAPGSYTRNLIDAVAEMARQADLAAPTLAEWDTERFSGEDLSRLAMLFGFERRPATSATGIVTLVFGAPLTRSYLVEQGTAFYFSELGVRRNYLAATNTALTQGRRTGIVPVVAEEPGAASNARRGAINRCAMPIENILRITNEEPVSGGAAAEEDAPLRRRMRDNLFRSRLGSEAYYRDLAMRHPDVAASQLITPSQVAEETLTVSSGRAESQEDSLAFSYAEGLSVFLVKESRFLTEGIDYTVTRDNDTPKPPVVTFRGVAVEEGDYIRLRHRYCSTKSRNDPQGGAFHYLDLYVRGRRPEPWVDRAVFPRQNQVGRGPVSPESHPATRGLVGSPCYVFVRQPVAAVLPTIDFAGSVYREGRDYLFARDATENQGSTRARDALVWLTALPPGRPFPAFNVDYYHEAVTGEVQAALEEPESHAAGDDILVHAAEEIALDFDFEVEWARGAVDVEALRTRLADYLSGVAMGSFLALGAVVGELYRLPQVRAVSLTKATDPAGREYRHTVPLTDGSVAIAGELRITNLAPNSYEEGG